MIYDPSTTRPDPTKAGQYIRDPFPGNIIPANRVNAISSNVVTYYPSPNFPGQTPQQINNYLGSGKSVTNTDNYFTRIDHYFSEQERLFGRVGYAPYTSFSTITNIAFEEQTIASQPDTNALIGLTSSFSPNWLGEFRLSYTRLQVNNYPESQGFKASTLGFGPTFTNYVGYNQFPAISVQTYNAGSGLVVTGASPNDFSMLGGPTRTLVPQDTWELQYQLNWIKGRHNLKFGTDLQLLRMNAYNSQYAAGQFNFDRTYTQGPNPQVTTLNGGNGLASLLLGVPVGGTITITNPLFLYQKYYALFIQDDYRVTDKLTINAGLRWEYQTPYAEKFGQIGYFDFNAIEPTTGRKGVFKEIKPGGYQSNPQYWNFSPRLGLAWQFLPKTVLRAAGGIFYATYVGVNDAATDFGNGGFISNLLYLGPANSLPNTPPVGGSWNNPFAAGIQTPSHTSDFVGQAVRADLLNRKKPYLSDYTLSIQRQITPTVLAEVGYVGSKMTHLYWNRQNDENNPLELSLGNQLNQLVPNPFYGIITNPASTLSNPTVQQSQLLKPYPQFTGLSGNDPPWADSIYHSLQVRIEKRFSNGLQLLGTYVFSKSIDDASVACGCTTWLGGATSLQDPNRRYLERSVSQFDIPHVFQFSYVYQFPFGRGKRWGSNINPVLNAILGGWQTNGLWRFDNGMPLSLTVSNSRPLPTYGAQRPNVLSTLTRNDGSNWLNQYFANPSVAVTPAPFTVGNAPREISSVRAPGTATTALSLFKQFPLPVIREGSFVEFRVEAFNALNHPQFGLASSNLVVGSSSFGIVSQQANSPRQVQLALKLYF